MDALARLTQQVDALLAAHGAALAKGAQLEERLAQALRKVHELEQERGALREKLDALPDPGGVEEAKRRLQTLLDTLEI